MSKMTINQIMVLLDAFRGTLSKDRHMGTYEKDVQVLQSRGLLDAAGEITAEAAVVVSNIRAAASREDL